MRKILSFLFFLVSFTIAKAENDLPKTEQLIVVKTDGWDTIHGKLSAFKWKDGNWNSVMSDITVVVGKKGLAWGKGLHDEKLIKGPLKKEGDGRSPAGIYPLTGLFGYGDMKEKMNYIKVDQNTFCVDDPSSSFYNEIVHADTVKKDWNSAETMRLKSDNYKYGIFVGYNTYSIEASKGSCIFIHIWDNASSPTAGCTALTEENILKLMSFLDKSKNPLLVQVPEEEYKKLKTLYKLP
jgi:D-alanyl-D-alanine dipeptidase